MTEIDFTIPGPVVFFAVVFAGLLTACFCSVLGASAYAIVRWADHKWGKPK